MTTTTPTPSPVDGRAEPAGATAPAAPVAVRSGPRGRALWAALAAAVIALLAVAVFDAGGAETDGERVQRLSASYACPACKGESVAESNAAVAATIREFIADEVSGGATDEMIRDQLVSSYGASVLLNPPAEGLAQLLWVLPVVVLVMGAAGVVALVDRGRGELVVSDADRALVESALDDWRAGAGAARATAAADDDATAPAAPEDEADVDQADGVGVDGVLADGAGGDDGGVEAVDGSGAEPAADGTVDGGDRGTGS